MDTLKNKIVWIGMAMLMIVTLVLAVLAPNAAKLTMSEQEKLALTYPEFTEADYATQSENVRFLAYFGKDLDNDGVANKLAGTTKDVSSGDTLYLDFNVVSDGTLEDGEITIGSSNFKLGMNQVKNSILAKNYISDDVKLIQLKNMGAGTHGFLKCLISADLKNDLSNFSKTTTIRLRGTYVASNGTRTQINKPVNLTVDWYGTTRTQVQTYSSTETVNYSNPRSTFYFSFVAAEKVGKLPIKAAGAVVTIPDLCGVYPTEVQCENGTYNEETHTVTIRREAQAESNGAILSPIPSQNSYSIRVTYPDYVWDRVNYENYTDTYVRLNFMVNAYYEVYNNENYTNPQRSYDTKNCVKVINIDRGEVPPQGIFELDFLDKEYRKREQDYVIDKQKLLDAYDNGNKEFYYTTYYEIQPAEAQTLRITNVDPDYIGTQDLWYSSTCYGVYVYGFDEALGKDGEIRIYNVVDNQALPGTETGEIEELAGYIRKHTTEGDILAFSGLQTTEQVEEYVANRQGGQGFSKENPYIIGGDSLMPLNTAAKKITIETSEIAKGNFLSIYIIKKINMDMLRETMTREELERASNMTTTIRIGTENGGDKYTKSRVLIQNKSNATVGINNKNLVVGDKDEPVLNRTISIRANKEQVGDALWKDGVFLVEIPEEIVQMEINRVGVYGQNGVRCKGYDLSKENGKYIVKIQTENDADTSDIQISINADMVVDPRVNSRDAYIRLFYYNPKCRSNVSSTGDIYDVNGNGSTTDYVGIALQKVHFAAANTLITFQIASNYDDKGSVTVSPNIAEISKEARSADILLSITNNFDRSISNTKILGRVPYENNKYILTDRFIGSDFTATMKAGGIDVPDEIKANTKVYYSEAEMPTIDIENTENGWLLAENVTDWTKIKSYLIDLSAYTLNIGQNYDFTYSVTVPEGLDYNETSYSTHAVIYDYNGIDGIQHFEDEPEKIGIKVTRLYDIDLGKFKEEFNLPVEGAAYKLTQKNSVGNIERENTLFSNAQGKMTAKNLYVNAEYELQEISAPDNYLVDNKVIKFKVVEQADKSLAIQVTSNDGFRNTPQMAVAQGKDVLQAELEDAPKYQLNITYVDTKADETINDVIAKFEDETYLTTDGTFKFQRLLPEETYTLEDVKLNGYEIETYTISVEKGQDGYTADTTGNIRVASIDNNGETDLVQVNAVVEKEGNERFDLEIVKVEQDPTKDTIQDMKVLEGAKFNVQKIDDNEVTVYETDENGKITLNKLYQYEDGKPLTGRYVINEEVAPYGYVLNPEEIGFKVITENDELKLVLENEASLTSFKGAIIEGNTVKIVLEDAPLFRLIKTDSETGAPLANAKFVIYELDENQDKVGFAKDTDNNFVGTLEDGKYVVVTNENGVIQLPLKDGTYLIEEVEAPFGYTGELEETFVVKSQRTVSTTIKSDEIDDTSDYVIEEKENTFEINYIEDLLDLGKAMVQNENTFSDTRVVLMRDLDFNEDSSYRNAADTEHYGDINENDIVEDVKTELTTGLGFMALGGYKEVRETVFDNGYVDTRIYYWYSNHPFSGVIDGQNHEIKNVYANGREKVGLFGLLINATVHDITVSGNVTSSGDYGYASGFALNATGNTKFINCTNKVNVTAGGSGGTASGLVNDTQGLNDIETGNTYDFKFLDCTNEGVITGTTAGGIIRRYYDSNINVNSLKIINCKNKNTVSGGAIAADITVYNAKNVIIKDCENSADISAKGNLAGIISSIYMQNGTINKVNIVNCTNKGDLSVLENNGSIGGIIGSISGYRATVNEFKIENCINEGKLEIKANEEYDNYRIGDIGGIVRYYELSNMTSMKLVINNCINNNDISGGRNTGGIVGQGNYGNVEITNCANKGSVYSDYRRYTDSSESDSIVGGLIGRECTTTLKVINCKVECDNIAGGEQTAGIIGYCANYGQVDIKNCEVKNIDISTVNPYTGNVAGICAYIQQLSSATGVNIDNCEISGTIEGIIVGGLIGRGNVSTNEYARITITNSTNYATLKGKETTSTTWAYVGGIAGEIWSADIESCVNKGKIESNYSNNIGGIAGYTGDLNIRNCVNYGNISGKGTIGGILSRQDGAKVQNVYNFGNITSTYSVHIGGIVGYANGDISNTVNKGNIYAAKAYYAGGIIGQLSSGTLEQSYNTGKVDAVGNTDYDNEAGGIAGGYSGTIKNCYNEGDVAGKGYVGGIAGMFSPSSVYNSYNIGNVKSYNAGVNGAISCVGGGALYGLNEMPAGLTSYYLDTIELIGNRIENNGYSKTWEEMTSDEFYNTLNTDNVWIKRDGLAPTLNIKMPILSKGEVTELNVTNTRNEYIISTSSNNGGSISGSGSVAYEKVKYGGNNTKEIKMTPNTGYEIYAIRVNGKDIEYTVEEDGTYTIPENYFTNMMENKHVYVEFTNEEQKVQFTINKQDETTNEKLKGAEFEITSVKQVGKNAIKGASVGEYAIFTCNRYGVTAKETANGYEWTTNNNYFGHNLTAYSYATVDLTDKAGTYVINMNVSISSEEGKDIGYAVLSTTTNYFTYDQAKNHEGKIFEISGEVNNADYSVEVEAGACYYIAFGYAKDADGIAGTDTMTINSLSYKEKDTSNNFYVSIDRCGQYYFEQENGKYVSDNRKKFVEQETTRAITGSTANAMMPINIPDDGTEYELEIEVSMSGEEGRDFGYLSYSNSSTSETYEEAKDSDELVFVITGEVDHRVYRIPAQKGSTYKFLRFGYYNGLDSDGEVKPDCMTIHSVKLINNRGTYTTDENGVIAQELDKDATYVVTETKAPEGYVLDATPHTYVFTENTEVTYTNREYPSVTTHYYLKENGEYTTKKVAEDVVLHGNVGDKYDTEVLKLEGLDLEKDGLGEYVVPENSYGVFGNSDIVVTYYYEAEPIELTIHHYTEGTLDKLAEDEVINADAEVTFDDEGNYEVSVAQTYELASNNNYRTLTRGARSLSSVRSSVQDNLTIDDTLSYNTDASLTYTYEDKEYTIATKVQRHEEIGEDDEGNEIRSLVEGGTISGQGQAAYEVLEPNQDATKDIVITANDGYVINKITVTSIAEDGTEISKVLYGEGAETCEVTYEGTEKTGTLSKFQDVNENKLVTVEFKLQASQVIVHHIIEGTSEDYQTVTISGNVGGEYRTSPIEITGYEVVRNTLNTSGLISEEPIHVYYFYDLVDCTINFRYEDKYSQALIDTDSVSGKYGNTITLSDYAKEIENYTLVESPEEETATYTVEPQTYVFKYAKNASVRTKHIKQGTEVSVADDVVENGYEGKVYTTSPVTLAKYDLVVTPANAEGTMAVTDETSETLVVYEYALKAAKVNVKYVDINKETENIVATETINGHVDDPYNVEGPNVPAGYVLMEENAQGESILPTNTQGTMTVADIDVIYYVAKAASVRTKHIKQGTQVSVADDVVENGYEGKAYTTSPVTLAKYDLVVTPANAEGTMAVTDETSETLVVYEYALKAAKVNVKYVDINKETENVVATETINGHVDDPYNVEGPNVPNGYVLMEENAQGESILPTNTQGTMTVSDIDVIYYVAKAASVRAIHVEEGTTSPKLAADYTEAGYEGKAYTTSAKEVDGYTLKATPANANGTMTVTDETSETLVVYEYVKVEANVVERYVDINSNEVVSRIDHPGHVGDPYEITGPTVPEGYVLMEENAQGESILPTNTEGTMTEEEIVVTYYVARAASVRAIYVKEGTTSPKLAEDYTEAGYEGKAYTTTAKTINGYTLKAMPLNATGTMSVTATSNETLVVYEYIRDGVEEVDTKVVEKYVDVNSNETVSSTDHNGHVGDPYKIEEPTVPNGYVLIEENAQGESILPTNTEGTMTEEEIVVTYYVAKDAKVTVKYIDIDTNANLAEVVEIPGYEGKAYTTEEKEFEEYNLVEIEGTANGNMTAGNQEVIYKYEAEEEPVRDAYVRVIYIDTETREKIEEDTIIEGYEGKPYQTTAKEIANYELLLVPTNARGTMTITEDIDGNINNETLVTYIYMKRKPTKVVEKYADINSEEVVESKDHPGKVGDAYEVTPTIPEGYVLMEKDKDGKDILPENTKGRMTEETIEVVYYVAKDAKVTVRYIVRYDNDNVGEDVIIPGYEGKEYKAEEKKVDGYELVGVEGEKEGKMKAGDNIVTFYYAKKATGIIPQTGINVFLYAMFAVTVIVVANGSVFVIYKFKK